MKTKFIDILDLQNVHTYIHTSDILAMVLIDREGIELERGEYSHQDAFELFGEHTKIITITGQAVRTKIHAEEIAKLIGIIEEYNT